MPPLDVPETLIENDHDGFQGHEASTVVVHDDPLVVVHDVPLEADDDLDELRSKSGRFHGIHRDDVVVPGIRIHVEVVDHDDTLHTRTDDLALDVDTVHGTEVGTVLEPDSAVGLEHASVEVQVRPFQHGGVALQRHWYCRLRLQVG